MTTLRSELTNNANAYKQPVGLYSMFFVELWERFGFYCVQSLLVLFLSKAYNYSDAQSYDIFSAYSALIFATPVIGGYLADKVLGFRYAVYLGGLLYIIGYFTLATGDKHLFHFALSLLICATGFFKSCISSLVGTLYEDNDPRRDSGFTIFYMGINIGSFLSPIICTWAATTYGWGYGFALAGIGMIIGMITAWLGFKKINTKGLPPEPELLKRKIFLGISTGIWVLIGTTIAVTLGGFLIQHAKLVIHALNIFSAIVAIALFVITFRYQGTQRNKLLVLLILTIISIFFWAFYNQTFSSLTLFTDRIVDRHFFQWVVPTAMFQSVNPFFIIVLSPVLATLWIKLNLEKSIFTTPAKFACANILMGLSFLLLPFAIKHFAHPDGTIAMTWLNLCYFLQTVGELFISPIGLAMITALAPKDLSGFMMGIWFLASAAAYSIGDYLADLTNIPSNITDIHTISNIYSHVFNKFGLIMLLVGIVFCFAIPKLNILMSEETH